MEAGASDGRMGLRVAFRRQWAGGKRLLETDICTLSSLFMPGTNLGRGCKVSHWNLMIL